MRMYDFFQGLEYWNTNVNNKKRKLISKSITRKRENIEVGEGRGGGRGRGRRRRRGG